MRKILLFIVFISSLTLTFASDGPAYCEILRGFGTGYVNDSAYCAADLYTCCFMEADAMIQIVSILNGNISAIRTLVDDIRVFVITLQNTTQSCLFLERMQHFLDNIDRIFAIIVANYIELINDLVCFVESIQDLNYFNLGQCTGDYFKILMTSDANLPRKVINEFFLRKLVLKRIGCSKHN